MKFIHASIKNFKGLRDIQVPLSNFVCLIGENNAGKSSLLQALLLFVEGKKIEPGMYFNSEAPVLITVRIEEISDSDLALIANEEHRTRFNEIINSGSVTLVRRYEKTGSSRLRWIAKVPNDARFQASSIDAILEGKRPGAAFSQELVETFPELDGKVDSKTNQKQARSLIKELAENIPDDQRSDCETDMPTGIDNAIRPFLPEAIYIPAVKDLADEIATKESASFGKLLGILLGQIAPLLDLEETFKRLRSHLNRVPGPDGEVQDSRLPAVIQIESLVREHVRRHFPTVDLDIRIPPPEVKTILSGAQIWVNDGVMSLIDEKGDGLKRAVTFAVLRSYVEMKKYQKATDSDPKLPSIYLFLFEEPELYLHPNAQRILFDALAEISLTNHVLVSTHSPLFFDAGSTKTFIKLAKRADPGVAEKPFAESVFVDLSDLDARSRFQVISYETNNNAFFSSSVVLVEGDSDLIVMPHIARTLDSGWAPERAGISFCKTSGKGSISRYRSFFEAFNVRVSIIADLDSLLDGFEHLGPCDECKRLRGALLQAVDEVIENEGLPEGALSGREVSELSERIKDAINNFREGRGSIEDISAAQAQLGMRSVYKQRRRVIEEFRTDKVLAAKRAVLRSLRDHNVHVLERGKIESYYPPGVTGADKPSKAMNFCKTVTTKDQILGLCDDLVSPDGKTQRREFELIFSSILCAT